MRLIVEQCCQVILEAITCYATYLYTNTIDIRVWLGDMNDYVMILMANITLFMPRLDRRSLLGHRKQRESI